MTALEITVFAKQDGPLTKRISLTENGKVKSDGSACVMTRGLARRFKFDSIHQLGPQIEKLKPHEAIALGRLRPDLPGRVEVVTKRNLNGSARPDLIARSQDFIAYQQGEPALALIDCDTKAMPAAVKAKIEPLGGLWPALVSVLPALAGTARIERRSTSSGLYRTDTGEHLAGSDGRHFYLFVRDGADDERFLKALHARCWLAALGWMMVGAGGQLLERSIVDRVVGSPERLVFEGAPVLVPPLAQDETSRRPIVIEGEALDTLAACPPLTPVEEAKLKELRAKEAQRLAPEARKARDTFIDHHARRLIESGVAPHLARKVIERQCDGVLLPDVALPFDDEELAGKTVADVLADPAHYEDATLADPLEGVDYGVGKAKIMLRADGTPWIHSFAHGRTVYELQFDYLAAEAALTKAPKDQAADRFVKYVIAADLSEDEVERLRNLASRITGAGKRALDARLKRGRQERAVVIAQQEQDRRHSERQDPRPLIPAPEPDAEWLPTMEVLNDVLGSSGAIEPPMRDFEGYAMEVRSRRVFGLHTLTALGSNYEDTNETRLPAPEQPLLSRLSEPALAELIERHIEFVDEGRGRSVHLGAPFVKHYLQRSDEALPLVTGVNTMPIVLPAGNILAGPGLVRHLNTVFRVPAELCTLLPRREDCRAPAISRAMRILTHEWLCDVATNYKGRCIIIACALTIIERALLTMRPAFFFYAGKRGGGKTTTINMVATAALGQPAAAAAWSPNEEERRKALFAYFLEGVPFLVWDNIARGTTISCPSIEKSLTSELYADRILGESQHKLVPATTIQAFTGNNIAPRGDMSSRSLRALIDVDRPDPENREFAHPDPIGWTKAHRGEILKSLYTILLGNPRRSSKCPAGAILHTRFKEWQNLIGSAVEHAAQIVCDEIHHFVADPFPSCPPEPISFKEMFIAGEADDEETTGLSTLLVALREKWRAGPFKASDVAEYLAPATEPPTKEAGEMLAALSLAAGRPIKHVSPTTVTWSLKKLINAPVQVAAEVMTLKCIQTRSRADTFHVETTG